MEKAIVLFFVVVLLVVLGGMALVWGWSRHAAEAANAWIALLANRRFDEALAASAPAMRARTDAAELQRFAEPVAFCIAAPPRWGHREFFGRDQAVVLAGACTAASGESITVVVTLHRGDGEWRVSGVRVGAAMAQKLRRGADLGIGEPGLSR